MSREAEELNRRLLRARDAMDRSYAEPLNVRAVAAIAHISPAHFSRCFRAVFGESLIITCSGGGSSVRCSCCARAAAP